MSIKRKNLQKILTLILIPFLSGCKPKIKDLEQCSPEYYFIQEQDRRYLDEEISVCRCRMYRRKKSYFGPIGATSRKDITYCNKVIGEKPDNYSKVYNFYNEIRLRYGDLVD